MFLFYTLYNPNTEIEKTKIINNQDQGLGVFDTSVPVRNQGVGVDVNTEDDGGFGFIGNGSSVEDDLDNEGEKPRLFKISDKKTSSVFFYNDPINQGEKNIRYIEIEKGHVYQNNTQVRKEIRISNTTIPYIKESVWISPTEYLLFYKDGDEVRKSFFSKLRKKEIKSISDEENYRVEGSFLPDDIVNLKLSDDGEKIFYIIKNFNNGTDWFTSNKEGTNRIKVYESEIESWVPKYFSNNDGKVLIQTKPSHHYETSAFVLNTQSRNLEVLNFNKKGGQVKVLGEIENILFSGYDGGEKYDLGFFSTDSKRQLRFEALADKCVLSNTDSDYIYCAGGDVGRDQPDRWYLGKNNFSDQIYKINVNNGSSEFVLNYIDEDYQDFDITELKITTDDSFIYFIDKKTLLPWALDIR